MRAEKRLSDGFQFLGRTPIRAIREPSPATDSISTTGSRTAGRRVSSHIVNLAGVLHLPWQFELGMNFSFSSARPFSAFVGGIDFNGDGTMDDLLPGTTVNAFNRGMDAPDLEQLVTSSTRPTRDDGRARDAASALTLPSGFRLATISMRSIFG